jgi:hypothetical protein
MKKEDLEEKINKVYAIILGVIAIISFIWLGYDSVGIEGLIQAFWAIIVVFAVMNIFLFLCALPHYIACLIEKDRNKKLLKTK